MKRLIIVLIVISVAVGIGIWWYNSYKNNQQNEGSTYQAERSSTNKTNQNINNNTNTNNTIAQNNINENVINNFTSNLNQMKETEIATFSTKIYNKDKERQNNIRITCDTLSSKEIKPGETFSFCDTVGKSTTAKGYQEADIYVDGKKEQGLGGGNCQVSTTLYNAVLQVPELEIIERHQHSGKVPYIEKGKDAAVAYGSYDFKFKNNTQNTIKIMMENTADNITAKILKVS